MRGKFLGANVLKSVGLYIEQNNKWLLVDIVVISLLVFKFLSGIEHWKGYSISTRAHVVSSLK